MSSPTTREHKTDVEKSYSFSLITISTSRYEKYGNVQSPDDAEDLSGKMMVDLVLSKGHNVSKYELISDNSDMIIDSVNRALDSKADIIITSGGTGLSSKDITIESLVPLFEKEMPGFGELFRYKSIEQIGSSVILTRAAAGIVKSKVLFCLPGSPAAVELALSEIILPETGHVVKHAHQ
ncbi:molybdenum cofactor biosynthesis protein B [Methanolobus mangrovi]|uniref:Molybdenum cofactor biosynthesis protein B n=1 Tax=Methanolobus mangrovi TaxID=3072977 RepID=A0AA51UFD4_9EURY|nr:molybdenum cofactor biosynthesis protein B [Methanolobus mangrovi]WMW22170.1 molybdenum cofactor biosynthesis protein B [Methanolobus mangrovi]